MVDPKEFGVDPADLSRKLASWLIGPGQRFRSSHAQLAVERGRFTDGELAYLVTVAADSLLQKGVQA